MARGAEGFAGDAPEDRHRTRRRLKRLRYATEFLRPWLPAAATRRALATMRSALNALGVYNDAHVAQVSLDVLDRADPDVAYARGWLEAQLEHRAAAAALALAHLARHHRFWA